MYSRSIQSSESQAVGSQKDTNIPPARDFVLFVKTERYEASRPNRESGAGKFLSDGEKIIVAHVN